MLNKIKGKYNKLPIEVKVSTSYAVCSVLQKCLSFITLPLFTRLLTTEEYGQYTIYSSWSGILMIFLTLNLAYGSFQTAMVKYENRRDDYISSVQGICILLSAIFLLIYLPFRNLWNKLFELPTIFVLLMVSEIFFMTSTQFWMEKKRFEYKYKGVVAVTLLTSILSPILAFLCVSVSDEKGYARIVGYAAINIIIGFIIFAINTRQSSKFYDREFWKYAIGFNVPLLIYYLSQVVFNQSDRIMISHITGTSDAAMYGVAYNLAMVLTFVLNAINGAYVPWIYKKIKDNREEENKNKSIIIIILMALMILIVIWYAPEIILIMAGKSYKSAIYVVAPVAMSLLLLFYSQLFINVEFYYEEKGALVYGSIGAAVLNIILNYLFIPVFGYVAAGYTTLVSYMVFAVSNFCTLRLILKKRNLLDNMYNYKIMMLIFVIFMFCGFLGMVLYNLRFLRIVITFIFFVAVIVKRNKFIKSIKEIREK